MLSEIVFRSRSWFGNRPTVGELVRNSFFASVGQIYQLALSGLLNILLARQLGVEAMGVYVATQALVGLIYVFARLGVDVPAKRETSRDQSKLRPYFGSALAVQLTLSAPIALLVALVANSLLGIASTSIVVLLVFFVSVTGLIGLNKAAMQALNRFDVSAKITIITQTVYIVVVALVLWINPELTHVLTVMVISQLFIFIVNMWVLWIMGFGLLPIWKLSLWRTIIHDGVPVMLASSSEYVNLRSDSIIIGASLGAIAAGIYGVAYSFYLMLAIIVYIPSVGVFPTLARYSANHDLSTYRRFVRRLSLVFVGFSSLVAIMLFLLAPWLVDLLYGEIYQASLAPLSVLIVGLPFVALNRLMVQVLNASDLQNWTFRATATGAVFNVLINLALIPRFGFIAAAYTTVITEAIVWTVAVFGLRRATNQVSASPMSPPAG